jgi:hypothetical protein
MVGYVLLVIQVGALVLGVYSFVHAAIQRPDAYTAAEKMSKPIWLAILGGTAIVICAAGIYLVDVRPKILEVQGKSR